MKLWYKRPAQNFNEALPIGNGHIGAMHYGNPVKDCLSLNDDTLWSGYPKNMDRINAYQFLPEIRKLIDNNRFKEAENIVERELLSLYHENYLPLGNLYIDLGIKKYQNYKRELDIENALTITQFDSDNAHFTIKCYVSYPNDCLIYNIECSDDRLLQPGIVFTNQLMSKSEYSDIHKCYYLYGYAPEFSPPHYYITDYPTTEGNKGMGFCALINAIDGEIFPLNGFDEFHFKTGAVLKGTNKVSFALTSKTGFNGYDKMPSRKLADLRYVCQKKINCVKEIGEKETFDRHIKDYKQLFDRVKFELNHENSKLPTDDRLVENYKTGKDKGLIELLFGFGRYLTISASRDSSQCMNLQGIWNDNVKPPWSSNYTLNINTQMNYWPSDVANLSECTKPLFDLIKNLTENGRNTAKNMYGMSGSCAHHNSDIWAKTSPVSRDVEGGARWAMWPMSLCWFSFHLFDHYLFTKNKEFLKNEAYDTIYQASRFTLDWFYEYNGVLKSCPSVSPENAYMYNGDQALLSCSSTMDVVLARELFKILLKTENILEIKDGLSKTIKIAIDKLPEYKIGSEGQLLEYSKDYIESELHHRHMSHLIGVYPFYDTSIFNNEKLSKAVEISMNKRGDESTGWSLAWKICIWARLFDGNRAEKLLQNQLRPVFSQNAENTGGIYMNMLDAHPPFQIDGNFGATAGICEMLMQSQDGVINILPAIPDSWESGKVSGLKARGNITVDIIWNKNNVKISLCSNKILTITLKYKNVSEKHKLSENIISTIIYRT